MRRLVIHREPALMGFARIYDCHVNEDYAAFQEKMNAMLPAPRYPTGKPMINNTTLVYYIDEGENRFFLGIYMEKQNLFSEEIIVPAGDEDMFYLVETAPPAKSKIIQLTITRITD